MNEIKVEMKKTQMKLKWVDYIRHFWMDVNVTKLN